MSGARVTAVAVGAALLLSGCGPLDAGAVRDEVGKLHSNAAEGALMAHQTVLNRTKPTFTRVHAKELASASSASEEMLHDATLDPGLSGKVDQAIKLADDSATQLDALALKPNDEAAAVGIEQRLRSLADQLTALESRL